MAKRKNTSKAKSAAKKKPTKRTSSSASAKKKSVRDVRAKKPAKKRAPAKKKKQPFTIHHMDPMDAPKIEPLDEDHINLKPDSFEESFPGSENLDVDIEYTPTRMPQMTVAPVKEMEEELTDEVERLANSVKQVAQGAAEDIPPKEVIKVKFSSFVQLVSQYDLESVMEANADEDIVMNANLLTDLASSREKREEKRVPLVFLVGIAIGVVLTYIFFST